MTTRFPWWCATGLSLITGCGATEPTDAVATTATAYVQAGTDAYRVIELGLDSETYREMVSRLDRVEGVVDLGPSTSGHREVKLHLDAFAPAAVYDFLLSSWQTAPAPGTLAHHTSFAVLLGGGGGSQAIGLLLPAVQKFNGVSVENDGTMTIEIAGDGMIDSIDGGIPQASAGGVNVAAGDVNGIVTGDQTGQLLVSTLAAVPHFGGASQGMESGAMRLVRPSPLPTWFDFATPVSVAVDIRRPGGLVLHRFRLAHALPQPDDGLDITLEPAKAIYARYDGVDGSSLQDSTEEAALVAASYATFDNRAYLAAKDQLLSFTTIDSSGGTPTFEQVQTYWAAERTSMIGALRGAVIHAAESEGLLCQVSIPTTATLASKLSGGTVAPETAGAIATVLEAGRTLSSPVAGAYAGPLAIVALAGLATSVAVDAAPACRALVELAPYADGLIAAGGVDALKTGSLNQAANLVSPRALDRELVAWIAEVDAIAAGTVIDNSAARAAARAKADILIEALDQHEQAAATRYELAHILVGS